MRSKIYRISSSSVRRQKDDYRGMVVFRMYVMRLLLSVFVGAILESRTIRSRKHEDTSEPTLFDG